MLASIFIHSGKHIMKALLIFCSSLLFITACNNNKENNVPPSRPEPVPATPPEKKSENGTTIKMDDNGVSYENKNGNNKSDVKISGDSTSVEIKK
jgi:hypothetical protein